MSYVVAVDTGGTFSDCVILDETGRVSTAKSPSTPHDYSIGVLESVRLAAEGVGMSVEDLLADADLFGHGTTVATNTLLTRTGSKVGMITTKGHEDAILIGRVRQKVAGLTEDEIIYAVKLDKPVPIVPRPMIRGVTERVDYKGAVLVPLNEAEALAAAKSLVEAGAEAIAVNLLWSFLNPDHEQRIKALIQEHYPDLTVMISSDIVPLMGEYERGVTTVIACHVGKTISEYLTNFQQSLRQSGFKQSPLIMQSSGGVASVNEARANAVSLLSSGPAGGVIAARSLGKLLGYENIITTDVGGTSFDVGLVVAGEPELSPTAVYDQYEVRFPSIDLSSIGAGGGSIAYLEAHTGLLKVGPQSAGADPGPVCYDRGGTEPTVTDANLILNRLDPEFFLGGRIRLNKEKAIAAIKARVADPLGLSVEEAAMGVVDILDAQMADLVRRLTIGRGYDPRSFVLFAFGGAGPLHVGGYARNTGVQAAVIPAVASEFSAFGIAGSDLVRIREASHPMVIPLDVDRLNQIYAELEDDVVEHLTQHGFTQDQMTLQRQIFLRYRGQVHEVPTPVPAGRLGEANVTVVVDDFEARYERKFGKGTAYKQAGIEARSYRVIGTGHIRAPQLQKQDAAARDSSQAVKGDRPVYFKEFKGFHPTPGYDRELLKAGSVVEGPAIVEAHDMTAVVHPGHTVSVDAYGNLIVSLNGSGEKAS
ncbi:MAG: hydantoinase/oxoprolinase family protein [Dehalococcoidia bacterium]